MTKLLDFMRTYSTSFIVGSAIASASLLSVSVQANNMYVYKDDKGQVLLTNNPTRNANRYRQKVQQTYYPPMGKAAVQRGNYANRISAPAHYTGFSTPSRSARRDAYDHLILASAARHGVDPALLKAMMHTESNFNPYARSHAKAQGLMQLIPATASRFKVRNVWDPSQNIEGAAKYVAWLSKRFNGKIELVVAGYNAGEGNVDKYGGIPPFKETKNYVKKVLGRYNTLYKNDSNLLQAYNFKTVTNEPTFRRVSSNNTRVTFGTVNNQNGYSSNRRSGHYGTSKNYAQSAFAALR